MNTAIDVNQLSVTLGERHILHDINVSVPVKSDRSHVVL